MYCLFWPFTVIDLDPDVKVGVLPHPDERVMARGLVVDGEELEPTEMQFTGRTAVV